ncbi:heme anaerobic degradation radical SAM methyltransferase ChuW/HutW [Selenomonadales bacterium OttesenSCG-928-I06]|nr:heme anaerobic degradation radical SAM methyltransferase ChuW/HutW [Selenomonadales bacterium OttesenSCG-928-I06]
MRGKYLEDYLESLDKEKLEVIVGLNNPDSLRFGFPQAKAMHPGLMPNMIEKTKHQDIWSDINSKKGEPGKRVAYIHIPFCKSKCLYCGFFQNFCNDDAENIYIDKLIEEIKQSQSPYLETNPLQAVYLGGGTPSCLSPANCTRLLQAIQKYLPLANDCELTFESRINDLSNEARLEAMFANGVNRISIGVQTFDTKLRQLMGRIDPKEKVIECLENLSKYDQAAIVIDLIYGFPTQTEEMIMEDLKIVKTIALDGFDIYHLKTHPNSPLQKAIENKRLPPAATMAEKAVIFAKIEEFLNNGEVNRLSVCHWSKNHRERSLYNTLSKSGPSVIPFGSGAGGNLDGYSMFLERDITSYMKRIDSGEKPIAFMTSPHWMRDLSGIVVRQIESSYLNLEQLTTSFGEEIREIESLLKIWQDRGLVTRKGDIYFLEASGRFWNANITQSLLECFQGIFSNISGKNLA